jgi:hypothetical protein
MAMAGVTLLLSSRLEASALAWGRWGLIVTLAVSGLAGCLVFVGVGSALRVDPIVSLWRLAMERQGRHRHPPAFPPTGGRKPGEP